MKLRNKKTGEIATLTLSSNGEELLIMKNNEMITRDVKLSDLEEWEDEPEEPKEYWNIEWDGAVCHTTSTTEEETRLAKQIGNYFETKEEAEKAAERLRAWKRLKDNGLMIKKWTHTPDMHLTTGSFLKIEGFIPAIMENMKDLDLLFSGGEE